VWQSENSPGLYWIKYSEIAVDGKMPVLRQHIQPSSPDPGDNCTDPQILDNYGTTTAQPALIGFLYTDGGATKTERQYFEGAPALAMVIANPPVPNSTEVIFHSDLRLEKGYDGGHYQMTHGRDLNDNTHRINVTRILSDGTIEQNESTILPQGEFHGYACCSDMFGERDLMIAYSNRNTNGFWRIFLQRYGGARTWSAIPEGTEMDDQPDEENTLPTMVPDSFFVTIRGADMGGVLIAWDCVTQVSTQRLHSVYSQRVLWDRDYGYPADFSYSWQIPFKASSQVLSDTTYPTIARVHGRCNGQTARSIVTWEGGSEQSGCFPPRPIEIMAQYCQYGQYPQQELLWPYE
jgi:hypothetical protein